MCVYIYIYIYTYYYVIEHMCSIRSLINVLITPAACTRGAFTIYIYIYILLRPPVPPLANDEQCMGSGDGRARCMGLPDRQGGKMGRAIYV